MTAVYFNTRKTDLSFFSSEIAQNSPLMSDYYDLIFNALPTDATLKNKLIAFTGPLQGYTRKTCFEAVRNQSGAPADVKNYTDYLFISDEHYQQKAISSKLETAIYYRRIQRTPLILREADWHRIIVE